MPPPSRTDISVPRKLNPSCSSFPPSNELIEGGNGTFRTSPSITQLPDLTSHDLES